MHLTDTSETYFSYKRGLETKSLTYVNCDYNNAAIIALAYAAALFSIYRLNYLFTAAKFRNEGMFLVMVHLSMTRPNTIMGTCNLPLSIKGSEF